MNKKLLRSIFAVFLAVFMFGTAGNFSVAAAEKAIGDGAVFKPGDTMTVNNATLWLTDTDTLQFGGTATVTLGTMEGIGNRYSISFTYTGTPQGVVPSTPAIVFNGDTDAHTPDGIKAVKEKTADDSAVYRFEAYYSPRSVMITNKPVEGSKLEMGESLGLNASVTPSYASKAVTWESSDSDIATVDANGTVTAVGAGTATITVKSAEDDTIKDSCTVTVVQKYNIEVSKTGQGVVSVSPESAFGEETVTVTVTPDWYWKLSTLTYTDASGAAQTISKNSEGAYTFIMPKADTTVNAVFAQAPKTSNTKWVISSDRNRYSLEWTNQEEIENVEISIGETRDVQLVKTVRAEGTLQSVDLTSEVKSYLANKTDDSFIRLMAETTAVGDGWEGVPSSTRINDLHFLKISLTNVTGESTGTLALDNGDEDTWYLVGDSVTVIAQPKAGYHLSKVLTHNYRDDITASFTSNRFNFTLEELTDEEGRITGWNYRDFEAWFEMDPPIVTLDLGEGHSNAVTKLYQYLSADHSGEPGFEHIVEVIRPETGATSLQVKVSTNTTWNKSGLLQNRFKYDLLNALGIKYPVDGEEMFYAFGKNAASGYTSRDVLDEEVYDHTPLTTEGITFHAVWEKPINSLEVAVNDDPVCGTVPNDFSEDKAVHPDASVESEHASIAETMDEPYTYWSDTNQYPARLFEAFKGGTDYYAHIGIEPDFGYYFAQNMTVSAGEDAASFVNMMGMDPSHGVLVAVKKTAVHDWDYENPEYKLSDDKKTATATVKCKNEDCDETQVFTDSNVEKRVQDPTIVADGVTTYTASFEHQEIADKVWTETIPMIKYQLTSGDGQTWTKGSGKTADFVFKRTYSDTSYDHFTGIKVDGKDVTKENYTALKGSTIVKLNAAYLETLSVGNHKLTGIFTEEVPDAGKKSANVDATFIVKEAKKSSGGSSKKPTTPVDNVVTCQMAGYPANYSWNEAAKACQPGYIDAGGNFHPYGATVRRVPNTSDRDIMIHAWIAMLSVTIGLFCAVKLLHEDWEV